MGIDANSSLQTKVHYACMLRVLAGFGSIVAVLALAGQVSPIEHPNLSGTKARQGGLYDVVYSAPQLFV